MKATAVNDFETIIGDDVLKTIGPITIRHPKDTFAITPASLIALKAIEEHRSLLHGAGIDWGCGSGCLSIAAARINEVELIIGLDILQENITISIQNALHNEVSEKTTYLLSDSYSPCDAVNKKWLESMSGKIDFILSNPPSSDGDDGFNYRRKVLNDGYGFLKNRGIVFLNISSQYGQERINDLTKVNKDYLHEGILASTGLVPFDLERNDLLECIYNYKKEEERDGYEYEFIDPIDTRTVLNATDALKLYKAKKLSPLTRWQTHLFRKSIQ